jgi:glycosyltransferase involved in cell wall biosynthesis
MKVKLISCWFATSYGAYGQSLRDAVARRLGQSVGVIATNCGCGDPLAVSRTFLNRDCDYFELPHVKYFKSKNPTKYFLRNTARHAVYWLRANRFHSRDADADVLHFQQILNAYGSVSVFHWLRMPCKAARVVTVHELDEYQREFPAWNLTYNAADRVIVHCDEMRQSLVRYGVRPDLIDVIEHGTAVEPLADEPRSGVVYYGGHHFGPNKGFGTLTKALALVRARRGDAPALTVHGHYGSEAPEFALRLVQEHGLGDRVTWLNQIPVAQAATEYRKAAMCVLPYTGSFAGYPAATAMANGAPVIATRRAGLPDHLGDAAIWIGDDDADGLAAAIERMLEDPAQGRRLATAAHDRATRLLTWDAIAEKTVRAYRAALDRREVRLSTGRSRPPEHQSLSGDAEG